MHALNEISKLKKAVMKSDKHIAKSRETYTQQSVKKETLLSWEYYKKFVGKNFKSSIATDVDINGIRFWDAANKPI